VAALLAANHARLGEGQSAHRDYYRGIKGEDQAAVDGDAIPNVLRCKVLGKAPLRALRTSREITKFALVEKHPQ
jgi:hypothetical protein